MQLLLLSEKLQQIHLDSSTISCITDYLTDRPLYVLLKNCVLGALMSSTCRNSHWIIGCVQEEQELEYRDLVDWYGINHLLLNVAKTKEMMVDFRRLRTPSKANHHFREFTWRCNREAVNKKGQRKGQRSSDPLMYAPRCCTFLIGLLWQLHFSTLPPCWGSSIRAGICCPPD